MTTTSPELTHLTDVPGTLFVTDAGQRLALSSPEVLANFVKYAELEIANQGTANSSLEFIGGGKEAVVRELPATELCIKTAGRYTGRKMHENGRPTHARSLVTELYFMDAVKKLVENRDPLITVPTHYATYRRSRQAFSMLQDRLPIDTCNLKDISLSDYDRYLKISTTLRKRVSRALGISVLRFGIGDLVPRRPWAHIGNIYLDSTLDPEGPLYLIDLIGNRAIRSAFCTLISTNAEIPKTLNITTEI